MLMNPGFPAKDRLGSCKEPAALARPLCAGQLRRTILGSCDPVSRGAKSSLSLPGRALFLSWNFFPFHYFFLRPLGIIWLTCFKRNSVSIFVTKESNLVLVR